MRRVFAWTALAIAAVLLAAIGAWFVHARMLAGLVSAQADVARTLIAANAPLDERFVRALVRDDLHVIVADPVAGTAIDAFGTDVRVHPIPIRMPGMNGDGPAAMDGPGGAAPEGGGPGGGPPRP
ncbi:MAG: hypothetical protein KGN02_04680, partial [bacterium]|nr:hypothetical protein [bacterium]